ncbi:PA domain containing protein [Trema orientale]|uniref:PA domain containing protein n=1 Tax=Trema orientale TaxID=63057 RepID=A0A2P5EFJ8_TREOI|nr:PA domain containing protein [Trema orientale]
MAPFTELAALFLVLAVLKNQQVLKVQFAVLTNSISVVSPLSLSSKHDAAIGILESKKIMKVSLWVLLFTRPKVLMDVSPLRVTKPFNSTIVLLDCGACFLGLKIWNAQQAGAAAVIVADEFVEPLIAMESPHDSELDVYKKKVQIPPALIAKYFGDSLKNAMKNNRENVVVKLEWQRLMPRLLERVKHNIDDESF